MFPRQQPACLRPPRQQQCKLCRPLCSPDCQLASPDGRRPASLASTLPRAPSVAHASSGRGSERPPSTALATPAPSLPDQQSELEQLALAHVCRLAFNSVSAQQKPPNVNLAMERRPKTVGFCLRASLLVFSVTGLWRMEASHLCCSNFRCSEGNSLLC